MAVGAPGVDVREVVEAQRRHLSEAMHTYTRLRAQVLAEAPAHRAEVARLLVLEHLIFRAEAETRWLDHCEARLLRLAEATATEPPQAPRPPSAPPA
jgi:hypothetical protein